MPAPDVDVVIGSRNARAHLVRCLEFVYGQEYEGAVHTTVVDNNSHDSSVFSVTSTYPQVQIIANRTNLGRAAAYNQALAATKAPYVLFLSQDVELERGFVAAQVRMMNERSDVAALAARVTWVGRQDDEIIDSLGVSVRGPRISLIHHGRTARDTGGHVRVFAPAESAGFWRRDVLAATAFGGAVFDEDIRDGWLQTDVAFRAHWLGYEFAVNPAARAGHACGTMHARYPDERREREAAKIRSSLLLFRRNLAHEGWDRYGRQVRAETRERIRAFARHWGVASGARLSLSCRLSTRAMAAKIRLIEGASRRDPAAFYAEVFGS
ncbi:glycosyltransferase [bacterium]|nr:glycosyltransferase [bacterium]